MKPGPKKPGESDAEYRARVKAMEERWMAGMGRPKVGVPSPGRPIPPPGMMYGPDDRLIPIPKKGGGTPVRDSRVSPKMVPMGGPADKMGPGAVKPGMPKMKAGGMVKGYKDGGCVMAGRGTKYKGQM